MTTFRQKISITGVANTITYDDGLKSTEAEPKRLIEVELVVDEVIDNDVQGYHERQKVFDVPDRLIDVETSTGSINTAKPGARLSAIDVNLDIPVGETFKLAIKCGATATDIKGCYVYEITKGA